MNEIHKPSEYYLRSRRNLVLFSFLIILHHTTGLTSLFLTNLIGLKATENCSLIQFFTVLGISWLILSYYNSRAYEVGHEGWRLILPTYLTSNKAGYEEFVKSDFWGRVSSFTNLNATFKKDTLDLKVRAPDNSDAYTYRIKVLDTNLRLKRALILSFIVDNIVVYSPIILALIAILLTLVNGSFVSCPN